MLSDMDAVGTDIAWVGRQDARAAGEVDFLNGKSSGSRAAGLGMACRMCGARWKEARRRDVTREQGLVEMGLLSSAGTGEAPLLQRGMVRMLTCGIVFRNYMLYDYANRDPAPPTPPSLPVEAFAMHRLSRGRERTPCFPESLFAFSAQIDTQRSGTRVLFPARHNVQPHLTSPATRGLELTLRYGFPSSVSDAGACKMVC